MARLVFEPICHTNWFFSTRENSRQFIQAPYHRRIHNCVCLALSRKGALKNVCVDVSGSLAVLLLLIAFIVRIIQYAANRSPLAGNDVSQYLCGKFEENSNIIRRSLRVDGDDDVNGARDVLRFDINCYPLVLRRNDAHSKCPKLINSLAEDAENSKEISVGKVA